MATSASTRAFHAGAVYGPRNSGIFAAALNAVIDWNERRLTRKALSGLTVRELDDIGLSRADVENM